MSKWDKPEPWAIEPALTVAPELWQGLDVACVFGPWGVRNIVRDLNHTPFTVSETGSGGLVNERWVGDGSTKYLQIDDQTTWPTWNTSFIRPKRSIWAMAFRMQDSGTTHEGILQVATAMGSASTGAFARRNTSGNLEVFTGSYRDTGVSLQNTDWHTLTWEISRSQVSYATTPNWVYVDGVQVDTWNILQNIASGAGYEFYFPSSYLGSPGNVDFLGVMMWFDPHGVESTNPSIGPYTALHRRFHEDPFFFMRPAESAPPVFAFGPTGAAAFVPYPNPRYAMAAGMQTMKGGAQ